MAPARGVHDLGIYITADVSMRSHAVMTSSDYLVLRTVAERWMSPLACPCELLRVVGMRSVRLSIGCQPESSTQLYTVFTCMYTFSPQQLSQDSPCNPTHVPHVRACSSRRSANQASPIYVSSQTVDHLSTPRRPSAAVAPTRLSPLVKVLDAHQYFRYLI